MSILLDALRKSEAQRHLGAPPTLQTPEHTEASSPTGGKTWIPVLMAMLAAVLITWMGLAQFWTPEMVSGPALPATEGASADGSNSSAVSATPDPAGKATQPTGSAVRNFRSDRSQTGAQPAPEGKSAEPEERVGTLAGTPVKSFAGEALDTNIVTESGSRHEGSTGAAVPSQGEAVADAARNVRLEPYIAEPLSYWQIPQSVREGMPQLRITVLVYAEKPEDRFLLVNGERLREQDELTSDLQLEEIQRDRGIFRYRNYRFYVKN